MANIRSVRLRELHGQLGDVVYQLTKVQFFSQHEKWQPAINAYRCEGCMAISVDLAGVDKDSIDLEVEPRRLSIRGTRQAPEPEEIQGRAVQILAMEIDHGPFEREIEFSVDVETERVNAEQRNGILWIYLPVRSHA
jgi:HSP20 family protein